MNLQVKGGGEEDSIYSLLLLLYSYLFISLYLSLHLRPSHICRLSLSL